MPVPVPHDADADADQFAGELRSVVAVLREHYLVAPSAELTETHLDLMMATMSSGVVDPDTIDLRSPRRRRAVVVASLVGASLLGTTGLAAAGVLPPPIQRRVAAFVQPLGVQLPTGPDAQTPAGLDPAPPQVSPGSATSEPATGQVGVHPTTSSNSDSQSRPATDGKGSADRGPAGNRNDPGPIDPGGKGGPTTQGNTQTTDQGGGGQSGPSVPSVPTTQGNTQTTDQGGGQPGPSVPTTQGNTQTTDQGGGQAEPPIAPTTTTPAIDQNAAPSGPGN